MMSWNAESIVDQTDRVAIVTGANSGLGFEVARGLSKHGATVVLACRDLAKAQAAVNRIQSEIANARLTPLKLDLADLVSVSAFSNAFMERHDRLDILVNNAGVMATPLARTNQGFELQIGTNHLGPFLLTAKLFPLIRKTKNSRIVGVSSGAAVIGKIDFADLNFRQRSYQPWPAYAHSKIAVLLFCLELSRKLDAAQAGTKALMAHPGYTATGLQRDHRLMRVFVNPLFMKPEEGALSILRAACDPDAQNGSYWGPSKFFNLVGPPTEANVPERAKDLDVAQRFWSLSEKLTESNFQV